MRLRFLGAAGTVTGSRTLVESTGTRVLVDCGLFQGYKALRERNREGLRLDLRRLDAVLLTHGHLDHSGWLPALIRGGYTGPVYCTEGTAELLSVLLPDAGRIQEEDASFANRKGYSRHNPALPLYTERDALTALERLRPVPWEAEVEIGSLTARFHRAGHILGASSIHLQDAHTSVLLSGDIGRDCDLVMPAPEPPPCADHVVIESTYGNRHHPDNNVLGELGAIVQRTVSRGGTVLIPAFAVGRAQSVLWALHLLKQRREIPDVPVILDSPMAMEATDRYVRAVGELRLTPSQAKALEDGVEFVTSVDASKRLNQREGPYVLVSASGMLTGGRVLHHLARIAPNPLATVLFVGFQAAGTRGARMIGGEPEIKVHGRFLPVRCGVARVDGFSAHADQGELLAWLRRLPSPPRQIWVNHGETDASEMLRFRIQQELSWPARVAQEGTTWELDHFQASRIGVASPHLASALVALTDAEPGFSAVCSALDLMSEGRLGGLLVLVSRAVWLRLVDEQRVDPANSEKVHIVEDLADAWEALTDPTGPAPLSS